MVLWMAVNDLNMSAVLLYQLFRYLWAVSHRRGMHIILVLAKQKVEQWELIGLWLSCEVERCIMQDEPDPPLPETVDGGCWPAYWWPHSTFFCSSKHRSQPSVWGLWSCGRSLIDAKPVFKKTAGVPVLLSAVRSSQNADAMQRGDHRPGTYGQDRHTR